MIITIHLNVNLKKKLLLDKSFSLGKQIPVESDYFK